MPEILLQPGNPDDLQAEDIEDLIEAIRKIGPNYDVRIAYHDQVGHRVTLWEVLTVWLPAVSDDIGLVLLIGQAVAWAQRRFKKEEAEHISQQGNDDDPNVPVQYRPKSITILGPNGNVLKSIVIHRPDEEPEDRTIEEAKKPARRRPPIL